MLLVLLGASSTPRARAQSSLRALDAAWLTPRLAPARDLLSLAASAGYGFTERIAETGGVHHRLAGGLGLGLASRVGLAAELRFDGRWDLHDVPERDDSLVGDPRLFVRYAHGLRKAHLGAELALWAPGRTAPSFDARALSVDFVLVGEVPLGRRASLAVATGPRFDQSAHSVERGVVLSPSDQLSLGVGEHHAWLVRLAETTTIGRTQLQVELSADSAFGRGAPRFVESPLRAALIVRHTVHDRVELSARSSVLLSARPALQAERLVPFEPRFGVQLGVRYLRGRTVAPLPPTPPVLAPAPIEPPPVQAGALKVIVLDTVGQPLPDVVARIGPREQRTSGAGEAHFVDLAVGAHELEVSGAGFVAQSTSVQIAAGETTAHALTLRANDQSGLRLQIRNLQTSAPVVAQCTLTFVARRGAVQRVVAGPDGSVELMLAPGRYRVAVRAPGFHPQTRVAEVRAHGLTLFNIDLKPRRR